MKKLLCILVALLTLGNFNNVLALDVDEIGDTYKVILINGEYYLPIPNSFLELFEGLYIDELTPTEQWIRIRRIEGDYQSVYTQLRECDGKGLATSSLLEETFKKFEDMGIYSEYTLFSPQEMGYLGGYKFFATAQKGDKNVCIITAFNAESILVVECGVKPEDSVYSYYQSYAYGIYLTLMAPEYHYYIGM